MSPQITINDRACDVEAGITILEAARRNAIYIPTLCDYPGLPSRGSCRMCVVDIQGRPNTPTACTTPVEDGMVIRTDSPKVLALRGELLQLLLSEHPSGCLFCPEKDQCQDCMVTLRKASETTGCRSCPKDDQCELQTMIGQSGLERVGYPGRYRMLKVEKHDPFYDRDFNLCILCGRCIRVCEDLHFSSTLAYVQRGSETVVGTAFQRSHLDAGCSFCGACVEACPTGSLMEKTRKWDGKPDAATASTCPFCGIGCQIELLVKNEEVIGSFPGHQNGTDNLCVKGRFGVTELVNQGGRLKQPQILEGREYQPVAWEEVYRLAAEKVAACPPERFQLLISSSTTNEDLYVARKFVRDVVKSRNITSSARARYGQGLGEVGSILVKSQPLDTLKRASAILCLGFDGRYAQSVVEVELHRAKKRGARLLSVNTQDHALSRYADIWLRPNPTRQTELIEALVKLVADLAASQGKASPSTHTVERMAGALYQAESLVVVVGPDFLTGQDNRGLLIAVMRLVDITRAEVVALPEQANLTSALQMGILGAGDATMKRDLDFLYLIGEDVPPHLAGDPFVLYQNICPPSAGRRPGLLLPGEAFTEADGSLTDHAGVVHKMHKAVQAPGKAQPAWKVLCEIARRMSAPGFDYACVEDIQIELQAWQVDKIPGDRKDAVIQPQVWSVDPIGEHDYLGFPLSRTVEGLQSLYPENPVRQKHV